MFMHISNRLTVNLPVLLEQLIMIEWEVEFAGSAGKQVVVLSLADCPNLVLSQEEGRLLWKAIQLYLSRQKLVPDRPKSTLENITPFPGPFPKD